jgi:hypothetical protein
MICIQPAQGKFIRFGKKAYPALLGLALSI